eukprot:scaffold661002_cov60-Prasinocladus_malaysianus.AAC.1
MMGSKQGVGEFEFESRAECTTTTTCFYDNHHYESNWNSDWSATASLGETDLKNNLPLPNGSGRGSDCNPRRIRDLY